MNLVRYANRILWGAGDYTDHLRRDGVPVGLVDEAYLDSVVAGSRDLSRIPIDLLHADTDQVFDTGEVDPSSLRREGRNLVGDLLMYPGDESRFKSRGLSAVIDFGANALRKLTVTPHPRYSAAAFSDDESQADGSATATFTGGYLMPDNQTTPQGGGDTVAVPASLWATMLSWIKPAEKPAPAPAAAFSMADVEAKLAEQAAAQQAAFSAQLAEVTKAADAKVEAAVKATEAKFSATSDAHFTAQVNADILAGVPANLAHRLRRRLDSCGQVAAFSADKPETDTDGALFADLHAAFTAASPLAQQLTGFTAGTPAQVANFDDAYAATVERLCSEARAAGKIPNMTEIARAADALCLKGGK